MSTSFSGCLKSWQDFKLISYNISLVRYNEDYPIEVHPFGLEDQEKVQATFDNLMKKPEFARKINYLAKVLRINYILAQEPFSGLYQFTRMDVDAFGDPPRDIRIVYHEDNTKLYDHEEIDDHWYIITRYNNEKLINRVYNYVYS